MMSSRFGTGPVESRINPIHHPPERLLIHELAKRTKLILRLLLRPRLCHPFSASSNFGSKHSLSKLLEGYAEEMAYALCHGLGLRWKEGLIGSVPREKEIADMQDDSGNAEELELLGRSETNDIESILSPDLSSFPEHLQSKTHLQRPPFSQVVHAIDLLPRLLEELVLPRSVLQQQSFCKMHDISEAIELIFILTIQTRLLCALQQLIKNVEASLAFRPCCHPTFLQQIPINIRTRNRAGRCKEYPNELAESTGIVVPHSLSVTKRFKDRIGLKDLAFQ